MKKEQILKKNWEFQEIVGNKNQVFTQNLIIYYRRKKEGSLRVGISISKKFLIAAKRNYVRRQVRKILTEQINFNEFKLDVVLIIRKPFIDRKYIDKIECVKEIFKKVKST